MSDSKGKGKILIVDDEDEIREIVALFVENFGYEYLGASSGNKAFQILKENPDIDVVLSDVMMADGSGVDLITQIRGAGMQLPVIFLTGYSSKEYTLKGLRMGVFELLNKPFESFTIKRVLGDAIKAARESAAILKSKEDIETAISEEGSDGESVSKSRLDDFVYDMKSQLQFSKGAIAGLSDDENRSFEMSFILRVMQAGEAESTYLKIAPLSSYFKDCVNLFSCYRLRVDLLDDEHISAIGAVIDDLLVVLDKFNDVSEFEINEVLRKDINRKAALLEEEALAE
jgi:DNA-binding response OmpR family regulator